MAQVRPVTSETLEAQIRDLLPSQNGFTEDLQAQNVIVPIIDLTAAAEGSAVRQDLQTALAFGSQTSFQIVNTTTNIITNTGFWRIVGTASTRSATASSTGVEIKMTDGLTNRLIWVYKLAASSTGDYEAASNLDLVVFVAPGITVTGTSLSSASFLGGSVRQIADVNGNLINPSGFTPQ